MLRCPNANSRVQVDAGGEPPDAPARRVSYLSINLSSIATDHGPAATQPLFDLPLNLRGEFLAKDTVGPESPQNMLIRERPYKQQPGQDPNANGLLPCEYSKPVV